MATLSPSTPEVLKQIINNAVADPQKIPNASVAIANKNGDILFSYAAGQAGSETTTPVTVDNIYWIASCTKISGSIVAMQAVEKGLLDLDSADDVEKYCPELKNIPILKEVTKDGHVVLVPKTKRITLRMLLTHTAGFGYSFVNSNLSKYCELFGINELAGNHNSVNSPLLFEPGTKWQYGVGLDWACILVSRAEGVLLNELIIKNIFEPAGVKDSSMRPNAELKSRILPMNYRDPSGKLTEGPQPMTATLSDDPVVLAQSIDSAGAGIFSRPAEYVKVLAVLLNKGVAGQTGKRILTEESVKQMFTNQLPEWPDFSKQEIDGTIPSPIPVIPQFYPQDNDTPEGWGLSLYLNQTDFISGRSTGSGFWCGVANLFYWIDIKKGVTGMLCTQILPFGDPNAFNLFAEFETTVYKGLQQ